MTLKKNTSPYGSDIYDPVWSLYRGVMYPKWTGDPWIDIERQRRDWTVMWKRPKFHTFTYQPPLLTWERLSLRWKRVRRRVRAVRMNLQRFGRYVARFWQADE